jgi:ring-opening amidohydrolase-like protein
MITKVAAAVREARKRAGIDDSADIHYVQRTPLLTIDTIRDATSRGHDVFTEDTLTSMDVSNGTAASGTASCATPWTPTVCGPRFATPG